MDCCTPQFSDRPHPSFLPPPPGVGGSPTIEQCKIPAGVFSMGDAHGDGKRSDGEGPVHLVELPAFSIDATSVTNADFARFVDATGCRTEAETCGSSAVFH